MTTKTLASSLDLLPGRIYAATTSHHPNAGNTFYRLLERLGEGYCRVCAYGSRNTKRPTSTRVTSVSTLLSYGLTLVDYDDEPEAFRSEEGERRAKAKAEARARAEAKARQKTAAAAPKSAPKTAAKQAPKPGASKPVSAFFSAETYARIEAFRLSQQAESDARGDGAEVSPAEAVRRLVRLGLATLEARPELKAAE